MQHLGIDILIILYAPCVHKCWGHILTWWLLIFFELRIWEGVHTRTSHSRLISCWIELRFREDISMGFVVQNQPCSVEFHRLPNYGHGVEWKGAVSALGSFLSTLQQTHYSYCTYNQNFVGKLHVSYITTTVYSLDTWKKHIFRVSC